MKLIAPDYYEKFECIKGQCRHSCCVGWEIDIDEDSYARFQEVPGGLGVRLREHMAEGEDGAYFRMTPDGRCPFLNGEGLCDLILELGEDCLCQICDDHPRFRSFFSDREEIGLGLCCEAAGRLILGRKDRVRLVALEDDGAYEELTEEEMEVLQLRDCLISIAQDRSRPLTERMDEILQEAGIEAFAPKWEEWIPFLLELERMDESWADRLKALGEAGEKSDISCWDTAFEQLLVYLLYRHLPIALEDDDLSGRIAYIAFSWHLVREMCMTRREPDFEDLVEICRLYSSELEYSDENIGAIIEKLRMENPSV